VTQIGPLCKVSFAIKQEKYFLWENISFQLAIFEMHSPFVSSFKVRSLSVKTCSAICCSSFSAPWLTCRRWRRKAITSWRKGSPDTTAKPLIERVMKWSSFLMQRNVIKAIFTGIVAWSAATTAAKAWRCPESGNAASSKEIATPIPNVTKVKH